MDILPGRKRQFQSTDQKPVPIVFLPAALPQELRSLSTWIGWRYERDEKRRTWAKIPINPHTGNKAKTNDPSTWGTFDEAIAAVERFNLDGPAIVLTRNRERQPMNLVGVDLDDCRDPSTGEITPEAADLIQRFSTYTETSPSGTGVKLLTVADWPDEKSACGKNFAERHVEIYREKFWCMTGHRLPDLPGAIEERTEQIAKFWHELTTPEPASSKTWLLKVVGDDLETRVAAYLKKAEPAVDGNNGSGQLMSVCRCVIDGFNLDRETAFSLISKYYNPTCDPPWSDKELFHKIDDVLKTPGDKPKGYLRDAPTEQPLNRTALQAMLNHTRAAEETSKTPSSWPAAIPLHDAPDVSLFPLDVFPGPIKTLIEEGGAALNVPHDYLALPLLSLAGAAIANSRHIAVTKTHTEPPAIYAVIVGPPGTLKTPALKILRKPFVKLCRTRFSEQLVFPESLPSR